MRSNSRRETLLEAAQAVVAERGGGGLTLDAVAAQAGLSKGGVLYHFPTKEALIVAMIDKELDAMDRDLEAAAAEEAAMEGVSGGAFARAYLRVSVAEDYNGDCGLGGLLAAVASDPSLLAGYRARTARWQERMRADGLDPAVAEIIRMATDGLYYSTLVDAARPGPEELPAFQAALFALSRAKSPHASSTDY